MQLKNTDSKYGFITKKLHLLIAALFITQYVLVYWREYIPKINPLNLQLILLHKSIGFTLAFIGIFFVIWRFMNKKPKFPGEMAKWEKVLATATHHSLYLVILIMPISGVLMSFLGGRGLMWFGIPVPNFIGENKPLAGMIFQAHVWVSFVVIFLVTLHVIGALKHHFVDKNNILIRMMR